MKELEFRIDGLNGIVGPHADQPAHPIAGRRGHTGFDRGKSVEGIPRHSLHRITMRGDDDERNRRGAPRVV